MTRRIDLFSVELRAIMCETEVTSRAIQGELIFKRAKLLTGIREVPFPD